MVFTWLALSETCTDTPRLSGDDCLQDDGMLEPDVLDSRVASHFTWLLAWTCGSIIVWISMHVTVYVLTISVRYQSDAVSIPGSHTCATASKPLVSYLEAYMGYVQSAPTLVTAICREHTIYPTNPVCRPTHIVAGESPSSTHKVSTSPINCWKSCSSSGPFY